MVGVNTIKNSHYYVRKRHAWVNIFDTSTKTGDITISVNKSPMGRKTTKSNFANSMPSWSSVGLNHFKQRIWSILCKIHTCYVGCSTMWHLRRRSKSLS